jgi:dihydrofolate reductase
VSPFVSWVEGAQRELRSSSVTNQYLAAGLIDELRLHVAPFVAGGGESLFAGTGDLELTPVSSRTTPHVTHLIYRR